MNAWPALRTNVYDGWVLRFSDGVTRRANSIYPIFESSIEINEKIGYCEELYFSKNLPVVFKITAEVYPSKLDYLLDKKGYYKDAETSFQAMTIKDIIEIDRSLINLNENLNTEWLKRFVSFNCYDKNKLTGYKNILKQINNKKCYLDLISNGKYIGCGLGVIEDKYVGIFDIVVDKKYRKMGFGKIIIESLLSWGHANGAVTAYLQVMLNNPRALRLYKSIGFEEVYRYWYRIKHNK
jgi:ribosomal protein S18 acetylase RimI-like enzyme